MIRKPYRERPAPQAASRRNSAKTGHIQLQLDIRLADTGNLRGPNHTIKSSAFPIEAGEDADTNPGVFGRSLANYLAAQMQERGWSVKGVLPEDFGYCVMLARKPLLLWIGCGNRGGRTDEWIAFAAAEGAS